MPRRNPLDLHMESSSVSPIILLGAGAMAGAGAASAVSNVREWWSKPAELSAEALENYEILTRLYRQAFPEVELPKFWLLDEEHRPKFKINYMEEDRCFENAIKRLDDDYRQIALLQKGMHVTVKQFLHSLSKRNRLVSHVDSGAVRNDGVELMFVMEMVVWMREIFKPESPQSMLELKQRMSYMNRICNELTTNNRFLYCFDLDEGRANFKSFCKRLMEHFQGFHDYLEQKAFNISLVDHVKQVNENLSVLISTYCNILYACIASPAMENSPSRYFLDLHLFLNPVSSDQKILELKRKELSNWLESTLSIAGIRNNGYVPEQALTKDNIQKHLEGKVPGDQHDVSALRLLEHAWGHWSFVVADNNLEKVAKYLQDIRKLHQWVLWFCFVQQKLSVAASVVGLDGEIWVYQHRIGKIMLAELVDNVQVIVSHGNQHLQAFWNDYYKQDFLTHARLTKTDDRRNPCYKLFHKVDDYVKKTQIIQDKICVIMDSISKKVDDLPNKLEEATLLKHELLEAISVLMQVNDKTASDNYQTIQDALKNSDELNHTLTQGVTMKPAIQAPTPSTIYAKCDKEDVAIALSIREFLLKSINEENIEKYLTTYDVDNFCNTFHQKIHKKILMPYQEIVLSAPLAFFSGYFYREPWTSIRKMHAKLLHTLTVLSDESYGQMWCMALGGLPV